MNQSKTLAGMLLDVKAVSLSPNEPYTWASGMKSPIYCDNRITLAFPEVRRFITTGLVAIIKEHYATAEVIAGTATAGIPQAALVAQALNLPMIYVRGSHKTHGKGNQIEGKLNLGEKVVVIEDLISTGGSCIEACKAIEAAGGKVLGVASNFTYQLPKGIDNFKHAGYRNVSISNYSDLIEVAVTKGVVTEADLAILKQWRDAA